MVAFKTTVRFIVYFCVSFIVQNNVIKKGEMPILFLYTIYLQAELPNNSTSENLESFRFKILLVRINLSSEKIVQ